ncbi:Bulb-type lectin domain containing protein, partial [Parasponia andersonii]
GVFVLGFFSPSKTQNYYLGIWYQIDPSRTVVWVANREKSVSFYSELRISDGNLVLFNESKEAIVWSTNINSTTTFFVQAVLVDNGNLVFNDGSNSSKPLWQSFDHLSHTGLPGSKIGYNKVTKTSQFLTLRISLEDPTPGLFSLDFDRNDSFIILWNRAYSICIENLPFCRYLMGFSASLRETGIWQNILMAASEQPTFNVGTERQATNSKKCTACHFLEIDLWK